MGFGFVPDNLFGDSRAYDRTQRMDKMIDNINDMARVQKDPIAMIATEMMHQYRNKLQAEQTAEFTAREQAKLESENRRKSIDLQRRYSEIEEKADKLRADAEAWARQSKIEIGEEIFGK